MEVSYIINVGIHKMEHLHNFLHSANGTGHQGKICVQVEGDKNPRWYRGNLPLCRRNSLLTTVHLHTEEHSSPLGRSYK